MFEKILHGGNVAACCMTIATTAAEIGITGGTTTGISGALSVLAVFKKDPSLKDLAQQMGAAFEEAVKASPLPSDTKKLIPQLMRKFPVTEEDIAKGILEPAPVAAIVRARIEDARGKEDPALTGDALVKAYEAILTQMLTPVLAAPAGMDPLHWAIQRQLLAQTAITGATKRMFEEGVTEKAIIGLAQKIAAETADVGQAWAELQNAMEMAVRVQADGRVTSNQGGFVDEVLHRVAELSAEGEYGSAGAEIDAALSREEEESQARKGKLLNRGVEVALLDRDTERAAGLLVRKADLEAGGRAGFENLRRLWNFYYERGRDKGVILDLVFAIEVMNLASARETSEIDKCSALNDIGIALSNIGEMVGESAKLEQAVAAYSAALALCSRKETPIEWATTKSNLADSLRILGTLESGTEILEKALFNCEAALGILSRDRFPFNWALTQINVGNICLTLGERNGSAAELERAVTSYGGALEVWTRDMGPDKWAMAKNGLGGALRMLGQQEFGTVRLEESVTAYEASLEEWPREKVPLKWAMIQDNLGVVFRIIGDRRSDNLKLEQSCNAFRAALEERTRARVPLGWAETQTRLGNTLQILAANESGTARLEEAVTAHKAALTELTRENAPVHWATINNNLGSALATLGRRENDIEHLKKAMKAYEASLKERTKRKEPLNWALTQENLARLELAFFENTSEKRCLARAMKYALAAREVFHERSARVNVAKIGKLIAHVQSVLDAQE